MSRERRFTIAVVVLNYRTAALVVDCLRSLAPQIRPESERVVVVDNCSGDGSVAVIAAAVQQHGWSGWVVLREAADNRGFAAGNNVGIQAVLADDYLLLNSDTYLRAGAMQQFRAARAAHPEVGLIAPRLEWPDGIPQRSIFRFHTACSEFERSAGTGFVSRLLARRIVAPPVVDERVPYEWASFAAILIHRTVFERVGLLDEGYFLYFEDVDYCRRAWAAGCKTLYWPEARVVHLRGGSGPVKERLARRERPPGYYYAARSRFFGKTYGRSGLWIANLAWWLGRIVSWPRELLRNKEKHLCEKEAWDIWHRAAQPVDRPTRWEDPWGSA